MTYYQFVAPASAAPVSAEPFSDEKTVRIILHYDGIENSANPNQIGS